MDSLLFWGFVLVALIVVTPFIAYDAMRAFLPLTQLLPGNNLNNQDAILRADVSEKVITLGGEAKLLPAPEAAPPFARTTWLLWGGLVAGVAGARGVCSPPAERSETGAEITVQHKKSPHVV